MSPTKRHDPPAVEGATVAGPYRVAHFPGRAKLWVLRAGGLCWGRIVTAAGREFEVLPEADLSDLDDDELADELAVLARKREVVGPLDPPGGFDY